jgi:hypothetical protein
MFKLILTILFSLVFLNANSQIGKAYSEVQLKYPDNVIEYRREGSFMVEDKQISDNETRMLFYNSDSVVISVTVEYLDSSMSKENVNEIIAQELPKFKRTKYTESNGMFIWVDSINNYLVFLNPASSSNFYPLKGIGLSIELSIYEYWIESITSWKRD